jgi:hypothetical protein
MLKKSPGGCHSEPICFAQGKLRDESCSKYPGKLLDSSSPRYGRTPQNGRIVFFRTLLKQSIIDSDSILCFNQLPPPLTVHPLPTNEKVDSFLSIRLN